MTLTARAVLKANRLFRDLPDPALDKLAGIAVRRSVRRGKRIFSQGDAGDSLLGLVSGQGRISATTPAGKEVFLNIMEPGDSFGEIAVLDGNPRTASAAAARAMPRPGTVITKAFELQHLALCWSQSRRRISSSSTTKWVVFSTRRPSAS